MKIGVILGTRPEIIKMAPVIRECEKRDLGYFTLHTGQHYSYEMDRVFFEDLELPRPSTTWTWAPETTVSRRGKSWLEWRRS